MRKKMFSITLMAILSFCLFTNVNAQEPKNEVQKKAPVTEEAPESMPGYESYVFRKIGEKELRLHVIKPEGWQASDKRTCFVFYFGGGWSYGNPTGSKFWTHWASDLGMVGVAPDYRVYNRFNSTIEESISDGRASIIWIQAHAKELGIDPAKIVVSGVSAGGHLAAWSAITGKGPSADDPGAPKPQPAALVLLNPATDTKSSGSSGAIKKLNGSPERGIACSVTDQMSKKMPPTILFHGVEDKVVPYANSVEFRDRMIANGNKCELVSFEGLGHMYYMKSNGEAGVAALKKTDEDMTKFLLDLKLIK
jgi:acetyl esterase/lipase